MSVPTVATPRQFHFDVRVFTGFDQLLALLPAQTRRRIVAKKLVKHFKATDEAIAETAYTFSMPDGSTWRITGRDGATVPA